MKVNRTPLDIEAMSFKRLTLVWPERAGKALVPVNPLSEIVAVKSGEANPVVSAIDKLRTAVLGVARKGDDESGEDALTEAIEEAQDSTVRSMLMNAAYAMVDGISAIMYSADPFDDAHRMEAVENLIAASGLKIAALAGNLYGGKAMEITDATKAGARHSAQDLADLKAAHDHLAAAHDATGKAMEHTGKMLGESDVTHDDDVVTPANDAGAKAGETSMTDLEIKAAIDTAVKAALEAQPDATVIATKAAEAAVLAFKPVIDAATATAEKATADAAAAKATSDAATLATETANAEKAASEKVLADAVKASRDRSAAGGHLDAVAAKAAFDAASPADKIAAAKPKTTLDAVAILLAGSPKAAA